MLETTGDVFDTQAGLRVLVVDDHAATRSLLAAAMRRRPGVEVVEAATGAAGISAARHGPFDLAFVDLRLPDMLGTTVIEHLRQFPTGGDARILLVTADAVFMAENRENLFELGIGEYLLKPFDLNVIFAIVDHCAAHTSSAGPSPSQSLPRSSGGRGGRDLI